MLNLLFSLQDITNETTNVDIDSEFETKDDEITNNVKFGIVPVAGICGDDQIEGYDSDEAEQIDRVHPYLLAP